MGFVVCTVTRRLCPGGPPRAVSLPILPTVVPCRTKQTQTHLSVRQAAYGLRGQPCSRVSFASRTWLLRRTLSRARRKGLPPPNCLDFHLLAYALGGWQRWIQRVGRTGATENVPCEDCAPRTSLAGPLRNGPVRAAEVQMHVT